MKILVLGASGMMGHMACRVLGDGHEVFGALRSDHRPDALLARFLPADRWVGGVDCFQPDSIVRALNKVRPEAVINCVGVVKQLDEAHDPLVCVPINSVLPHQLAGWCGLLGAKLIHMSTDCVFSGSRGSYTEADVPDPIDLYGRSKSLGEVGTHNALTLRTSIVGRQLAGRTGLFEWFISQRGETVSGFTRAIYTGLTTQALARVMKSVLEKHYGLSGVWQVASAPVNKFDLLQKLNERLGLNITIKPNTDFFCDRSLDGSRFALATGITVPTWDQMIDDFVADDVTYR